VITVVGAGRVGSAAALDIVLRRLDDVLLLDIVEGLPQGEALDLGHAASSYGIDVEITGSNDYRDMAGSDIVVVTAGVPRRPGMTRLDLLQRNAEIVRQISSRIVEYAPKSKLLMVTNPLDAMTYLALKATGFPPKRVFGMGSILDSARFRYFLSKRLGVSRSSIQALVIGEHGENMLPLLSHTSVSGVPLPEIVSTDGVKGTVEETRGTAAEVIRLKGGTVYAPAAGVGEIVEAVVKDRKAVFPISAYLDGEYGVRGVCIGVPAVLGREGIERIVELQLVDEEMAVFMRGVEALKKVVSKLEISQ